MKDRLTVVRSALALGIALTACSKSRQGGGAGANGGSAGFIGGTTQIGGGGNSASGTTGGGTGGSGGSAGVSSPAQGGSGAGGMSALQGVAGWRAYMDATPATLGTPERGKYLVDHVLVCGVCHTPSLPNTSDPDPSKYLAGSRPYDFTDVDGTVITVNAENLTSHDPEGLHAWSDGQIRTAITKGVDDEHYAIYPIMPYPEYSLLKPDDVDSIIKYLRTVPASDNVVASDYPRPDVNPPANLVDETKIPHTTLKSSDPDFAAAERGRYLASVACLNCHTDEVVLPSGMIDHDVPNLDKAFGGGKQYTFEHLQPKHTSVNITPDATGLAGWTVDDIVNTLKTDKEKGGTGRMLCNTHPSQPERLAMMTDADMKDVATYIHTLPPVKNGPFKCMP